MIESIVTTFNISGGDSIVNPACAFYQVWCFYYYFIIFFSIFFLWCPHQLNTIFKHLI